MNAPHNTVLEKLDALVAWSNASSKVAQDMAPDGDGQRQYLPMRWLPLLLMAVGAGFVAAAVALSIPTWMFGTIAAFSAVAVAINANGPLGKPSIDDDEREAALRKDAWLFCLAVLAFANIFGQPVLAMAAVLQGWPATQVGYVALAVLMCNLMWLTSLRTLYASWKLSSLPDE